MYADVRVWPKANIRRWTSSRKAAEVRTQRWFSCGRRHVIDERGDARQAVGLARGQWKLLAAAPACA